MSRVPDVKPTHSPAWVAQTWVSFVIAAGATLLGIYCLPVDVWIKAFMGMGVLFTIGSTFSLAKTVRDLHEQETLVNRIDEARVSKLIAEHDPLKPAL